MRPIPDEQAPRDDAAQLRLIADNVPAMSIAYDRDLRCLFANRRFAEFFGLTTANIVGRHLREIIGEVPYQEVKPYFDRTLQGHRATYKRTRVMDCGENSYLEVELIPHIAPDGRVEGLFAVTTDVTERKREEQLRILGYSVAGLIANADTSTAAIKAVIAMICETERWDCGRYFQPPSAGAPLRLAAAWGVDEVSIQQFLVRSRHIEYAPGIGMTGAVWQTGQPCWIPDVFTEPRTLRRGFAPDVALHGAFIFPVRSQGAVIGVLSFNSRDVRAADEALLQAILAIGSQIGQFLQRKRAEEQLRESEARFRSLCALSSDVFWEQDAQHRVTSMSDAAGRIDTDQFLGKAIWELEYGNMAPDDWAAHRAVLDAHRAFRDLELCRPDRFCREAWYSMSGEPVFDASGAFTGYRGLGREITDRKFNENRIRHLASHDTLTGLPNRTNFSEVLNAARESARRHKRTLAVMFADLDGFKDINDALGHEIGDRVLREVGARLRQALRASDVVARFGGDEFVVLLQELQDEAQAEVVARKMLAALAAPMTLQGHQCAVTASVGICIYPTDAEDEQSLLTNADAAMYRAKQAGKNNFRFYAEDVRPPCPS